MRQLLEKARNVNPGYSPIEDDDDDRLDEQVGNHMLYSPIEDDDDDRLDEQVGNHMLSTQECPLSNTWSLDDMRHSS